VWVHLYDPHDPYEPPAPYSLTYKDHLYDGEIAYADSALGHFMGYLKQTGRYRNSIVIVVGDHGEGLGEHKEETHGIFLYDSTTHVPLIIKLPSETHAKLSVQAQVRTVDIVPTLLDLVGAPAMEKRDGESLMPYMAGDAQTDRPAFGETDYPLRFGWAPLRSLRTQGFKFIEAPRPELYSIESDPGELHSQYDAKDPRVEKARTMLAEVAKREAPTEKPQQGSGAADTQLKGLGYAGQGGDRTASPAGLPDPKDKIEEQNLLHRAMLASDDHRIADARRALEQVLALDPKSPTALRQLGELELQSGEYAKAAEHLKGAIEVRPDDSTAAFEAGQAMEKSGDLPGSRDALETSLKLMPGQFAARLLLGQVYLRLRDTKAAEDQFEAALLIKPDDLEGQLALVEAQIADGKFAEAARQLEALAKEKPNHAAIFDLLVRAYTGLGKTDDARRAEARSKVLHGRK
jgi:tetratricopeptide (TPR) repeat protein